MGAIQEPIPVLLILAAFSRYREALDWAHDRAFKEWGEIVLESPEFAFTETRYYEPTMGTDLKKKFFAFRELMDPTRLADIKIQTCGWEQEYTRLGRHPEPRPLNLDPGYITLGKLVLASTKDFTHRIYLSRGIYGEVTLTYRHHQWDSMPWTFPDYRRPDYHEFFSRCRQWLHEQLRESAQA